ncbi:hydrogenase maturation nickel metallochaperone HypA [Thermodesulforhabdus norvegica]|uniref:Hydrogenase maturation factor HypA n=1 Tax=Thermodesulforhabdus norvegica TaxID=39841 RepID=A0A1I4V080_9BACT|nr:hydrogenase maturation nickel metallochaperone HypA [Thermodesulforhabdus norvegica]SFM94667.1 hydrogenase nickel incorporation protein HypA/HybF [Thermodesulforhabdus norvegica]
MSIAQALFDIVRDEAERHGLSRVERVAVQVGEMAAVVPEALRLCFSIISRGTFAENSELDIEIVPVVARCRRCGLMFEVENFSFRCPDCGTEGADCMSGRELLVLEVEGLSGGEV